MAAAGGTSERGGTPRGPGSGVAGSSRGRRGWVGSLSAGRDAGAPSIKMSKSGAAFRHRQTPGAAIRICFFAPARTGGVYPLLKCYSVTKPVNTGDCACPNRYNDALQTHLEPLRRAIGSLSALRAKPQGLSPRKTLSSAGQSCQSGGSPFAQSDPGRGFGRSQLNCG